MTQFSYKNYYRRNLPHVQPEGATLFVTFRLANCLPLEVIHRLQEEKEQAERQIHRIADEQERENQLALGQRRHFEKWDEALDHFSMGEKYLADPHIADLVAESLHFRDGKVYDLDAFTIMPTHVHLVCTPLEKEPNKYFSLSSIMHSLKRYTASEANQLLGRSGSFWQHENYDHFVRNENELEKIIKYVIYNPVKAGLIENWTKWKWTYCKYDI
jgi:REP element-mobilizing transposase RayT